MVYSLSSIKSCGSHGLPLLAKPRREESLEQMEAMADTDFRA